MARCLVGYIHYVTTVRNEQVEVKGGQRSCDVDGESHEARGAQKPFFQMFSAATGLDVAAEGGSLVAPINGVQSLYADEA